MGKKSLGCLVAAFGLLLSLPGQADKQWPFRDWYREALRLYHLDEPTTRTDSIALDLFLKTAESANNKERSIVIDCLIKAGNIHQSYARYPEANVLYHNAILVNQSILENPSATYEAYLYLGSSLYFSNVIDSAQYYFEAASEIDLIFTGKDPLPEKERLYNSLGAIYFESANYQQAKNYFQKALEVSFPSGDSYEELYTGIRSNIASCLMKLNQYDSALTIFKSLSPTEQQRDLIRQNTAHSYFETGEYDSALLIYKSLPLQNNFTSVVALTDMGRIYMKRKQWQQAEVVFDSAIARNKNISLNIKNKEEALAYLYRGQLAREQGLMDEALVWVNEALKEVHLSFEPDVNSDLPEDISQTVSPITLFQILHEKAGMLYQKFNQSGNLKLLEGSLAAYRKAMETGNFIKLNFDNDEAKLFFNDNYQQIYKEAVSIAYKAVAVDPALVDEYIFIIENYKGNVLSHNLQDVKIKSAINVPDSILRRERELKQLLSVYTTRLNQADEEKEAAQLRSRVLSLQVELSRHQKYYEKDTSYNLYKYQAGLSFTSLQSIQGQIDNKTGLINFFMKDSVIYSLVITKNRFLLNKISADAVFYTAARSFVDASYEQVEGKRFSGHEASAILYQYLIQPLKTLINSCENWVIIPDGLLYYLPFEALLPEANARDYLLLTKSISYHYSFSLLLQNNSHHRTDPGRKTRLAFAPFAFSDTNTTGNHLPRLPHSLEEIGVAGDLSFAGNKATKNTFLQVASQHPVIHLATHAKIGSDSSNNWIQFYPTKGNTIDNRLFVHEIYNLDLHKAELVVLSACETAGGAGTSGEGLLSLSRAFLYAGADGIISTLWKTEDRVSAYLMKRMHKYLQNEVPPGKALQLAKKDLLNDPSIGSQYKTPNYWANFVYTGKLPSPPSAGRKGWLVATALLFIIGLPLIVFWKRRYYKVYKVPQPEATDREP